MVRRLIPLLLLATTVQAATTTWQGDDPAKPTEWAVAENWSGGAAPDKADDAVIPGGLKSYPVLSADAEAGSLAIAKGASLALAGHCLSVAVGLGADFDARSDAAKGLAIEGTLDASKEGSALAIGRGGVANRGRILGQPALAIRGAFHGLTLDLAGATLSSLSLTHAIYPYPVTVKSAATVAGNAELTGGNLIVASEQVLTIQGGLVFRGKAPAASLTPNGEVRLQGTIASEGSAAWDSTASGWVRMVGEGDQVITTGGFLPPIKLEKPSGKVTATGDLYCAGLWIAQGNTLDLSKGQKLLFGTTEREWHIDPKDRMIVKTWLPHRSSRDLTNLGTILGVPSVPFVLYVRSPDDKLYAVSGSYRLQGKAEDPLAGRLAINAPDARLALKGDQLLLDGKPPTKGAEDELTLDDAAAPTGKAQVTHLAVTEVPPAEADRAGLVNVAPRVQFLRSVPSIGRGIWHLADGSPSTVATFRSGVGGGGMLEFIFETPVAVSLVRFRQEGLFAIDYLLTADTTGDGRCETLLAVGNGGAPKAWREHAFPPTRLHRLRFRALRGQQGWEQAYPQSGEFEIYAEAASAAALPAPPPATTPVPADVPRLALGPDLRIHRPPLDPSDRIFKSVMIDLWMFHIQTEQMIPKTHLRDFKPFQDLVAGLKDLGADTATLFIEANPIAFWPSRNFKSITNKTYFDELDKKKLALREAAARQAPKGVTLEEKLPEPKPEQALEIDPPNKKDILREFCEGMHENGIQVFVLFLAPIMEKYVGPPGADGWQVLCEEVAARGADGVYVAWDEAWFGLANPRPNVPPDDPQRLAFKQRWGQDADLPARWEQSVNYRRHVLFHYEKTALALQRRCEAVKKINPLCLTLTNIGSHPITANNRMTYGLAYDVIGHIAGLDFLGTDYVPQETRSFVGAARNRKATMCLGAGPPLGEGVSCLMQGARALNYYRYNYIELWKATDLRRREFQFIRTLESWGVAKARTPRKIALLLSRASEDWWDNLHGTYWLGGSVEGKQGFWTSRLINAFLLENGYPFDLYYLDQPGDPSASLRAGLAALADYKLLIVPFPYSVSRAAAEALRRAQAAGAKLLIAQKQGEVDELGVKYDQPILNQVIDAGSKTGKAVYLDRNLVEWEVEPDFLEGLGKTVDGLLGADKPMTLNRHGHRVEAGLVEKGEGEQILTLINWGKEAEVEVGLSLPKGDYKLITASSDSPMREREGQIGSRAAVSADDLKRFAVKLGEGEVRGLCIQPARDSL